MFRDARRLADATVWSEALLDALADQPHLVEHAAALDGRAGLFLAMGDLNSARPHFQLALDIRQKLADADPSNASAQRDLSLALRNRADVSEANSDASGSRTEAAKITTRGRPRH